MKLENQVSLRFLKDQIKLAYRQRKFDLRPILMVGESGIGKTAIVKQCASELGIGFQLFDFHTMESPDLRGLSRIDPVTGRTVFQRPAFIPDSGSGFVMIDEINRAERDMIAATYNGLSHREFGGHKIPDDWVIVAACNPSQSQGGGVYDVVELDPALKGRFRVFGVSADVQGFLDWLAADVGASNEVFQFVVADTKVVSFDGGPGTPRDFAGLAHTIEAIKADMGKKFNHLPSTDLRSIAAADVGIDLAASFSSFRDLRAYCTPDMVLTGAWNDCEVGLLKAKEQKRFDVEMAIMRGVTDQIVRAEKKVFPKVKLDNVIRFYEFLGGDKSLASLQLLMNEFERTGDKEIDNRIDRIIDKAIELKSDFVGWAKEVVAAKKNRG